MIRSAASKVMWVGKATALPVVLAVMLVVVFGTTPASAHGGYKGVLHLGHSKAVAKATTLVGKVATGSALVVKNPSGGSALGLEVNAGKAPLSVNAEAGKATNLDVDKLDGRDSTALLPGGDLPRGRTVRGHYMLDGTPGDERELDSISFGYRLASAPTERYVKPGITPPTECPGTVSSPEAAPGYLCIYVLFSGGVDSNSFPTAFDITRNGAYLSAYSSDTSKYFLTEGTWAVTGN